MSIKEFSISKIQPFLQRHSVFFAVAADSDKDVVSLPEDKYIEDFEMISFQDFSVLIHKLHWWDVDFFPREVYDFVCKYKHYEYDDLFKEFDKSYTDELRVMLRIVRDTSRRSTKESQMYKKFSQLAKGGYIGAFEYFKSHEPDFADCYMTYIYDAAIHGHFKFIKYFHESEQLKLPEFVDMRILKKGHWQCYDYLYSHGSKIKIVRGLLDTQLRLETLVSTVPSIGCFDFDTLKYACQTFHDHEGKEVKHIGHSIHVSIDDYCKHFDAYSYYHERIATITVYVSGCRSVRFEKHEHFIDIYGYCPYCLTAESIKHAHEHGSLSTTEKFKRHLMLYVSQCGDFETYKYLQSIGYQGSIYCAYSFITCGHIEYLQSGIDDLSELSTSEGLKYVLYLLSSYHCKTDDVYDTFKCVFESFYLKYQQLDDHILQSLLMTLASHGSPIEFLRYLTESAKEDVLSLVDWTLLMKTAISHSTTSYVKFILDKGFEVDISQIRDYVFVQFHSCRISADVKKLLQQHGF